MLRRAARARLLPAPPPLRRSGAAPRRPSRGSTMTAYAFQSKPGLLSTLVTEGISRLAGDGAAALSPAQTFVVSGVLGTVLPPLFYAALATALLRRLAGAARAWVGRHPDEPVAAEVVALAPAVLERPFVLAVWLIAGTRLARNAVWLLDAFVHRFKPALNRSADALVESVCEALVPLDRLLLRCYAVLLVGLAAFAACRLKSIALELVLDRQRQAADAKAAATAAAAGGTGAGAGGRAAASPDDLERLLVPLDAFGSWAICLAAALVAMHLLGVSAAPLLAVGGASSLALGLASQQVLANTVNGVALFLARPFVAGDSVTLQGVGGIVVTGVVETVSPMRTTLLTDDSGVIVTIPNKTVADMVVFNRSATVRRTRLARANRASEPLKLRVKVPHAACAALPAVSQAVVAVLQGGNGGSSGSSSPVLGASGSSTMSFEEGSGGSGSGGIGSGIGGSGGSGSSSSPVVPGSVEVQLSKLTDAGVELLVKGQLRCDPASARVQALLLELSAQLRPLGATLVTL